MSAESFKTRDDKTGGQLGSYLFSLIFSYSIYLLNISKT